MKINKLTQLVLTSTLVFTASAAIAAPKATVSRDQIEISELYNADVQKKLDEQSSKLTSKEYKLAVSKVSDDELKAIIAKYPDAADIKIDSDKVTSIAPIAAEKSLQKVNIRTDNVTDFSVLGEFDKLSSLSIESSKLNSLKWMSKLERLSRISIKGGSSLTDLTGLPKIPSLKDVSITHAKPADLSLVAAAFPGLKTVDLKYSDVADLKPLCALDSLTTVDLYGATVADYGQLETCSKLTKITTYASKTNDFAALAKIKSLVEINGGLTSLSDVSWVTELPNLKKFDVFSEKVTDLSPVAKSTIEDFKVWSMKEDLDLATLANAKNIKKFTIWGGQKRIDNVEKALETMENLEKLELTSMINGTPKLDCSFAKNLKKLSEIRLGKFSAVSTAGLESLASLTKISFNGVHDPLNLAFAENLAGLESLELIDVVVENSEALAKSPKLQYVYVKNAKGFDLEALKKNPNLKRVTLSKKDFKEDQVKGFADGVKVSLN